MAFALETLAYMLYVCESGIASLFFAIFIWKFGCVAGEDGVVEGIELGLETFIALGLGGEFLSPPLGFIAQLLGVC